MRATRPSECPRCGRTITPRAGLYLCDEDGMFGMDDYFRRDTGSTILGPGSRMMRSPPDADDAPATPIDGRPIPLDRRLS